MIFNKIKKSMVAHQRAAANRLRNTDLDDPLPFSNDVRQVCVLS